MIDIFLKKLKHAGWKQSDIATKVNLRQSYISELYNGKGCSIETVLKFADAFNVSTDEVLGRSSTKVPSPIIDRIEQLIDEDEELAREVLKRAEVEKLAKAMRGEKGRGNRRKAA